MNGSGTLDEQVSTEHAWFCVSCRILAHATEATALYSTTTTVCRYYCPALRCLAVPGNALLKSSSQLREEQILHATNSFQVEVRYARAGSLSSSTAVLPLHLVVATAGPGKTVHSFCSHSFPRLFLLLTVEIPSFDHRVSGRLLAARHSTSPPLA